MFFKRFVIFSAIFCLLTPSLFAKDFAKRWPTDTPIEVLTSSSADATYVPYNGAISNVNLGSKSVQASIVSDGTVQVTSGTIRNINNLLMGDTSAGTYADSVIVFKQSTPPQSVPTEAVQLYARKASLTYGSVDYTGTATASNALAGDSYKAANAYDANTGTFWLTDGSTAVPHWLKVDFGVGVTKTVTKAVIYPYADASNGGIKNFQFQGSNDDSNWTDVYSGVVANGTSTAANTFTFQNLTAYRYYRVYITSTYRADNFTGMYELELYEGATFATKLFVRDGNGTETQLGA